MAKKRRKIKKKVIVILIISVLLLSIISLPYLLVNIKLIGNKVMKLDYGERYNEPGYKGTLLNKNITKNIKVTGNVLENEDKYVIKYQYRFGFLDITKKRYVIVKDISGPKIELIGGDNYEITIDSNWEEPGFTAIDNKDGDVSNLVKISGTVDTSKLGIYNIVYTATDNSANETKITRTVKVEKKKPTQMSVSEYSLDGWYDDIKLKETTDYGDDYFNKIKMVGDSNTMNMYLNGILNGNNAWAIPCLHAESMHRIDINLYGLGLKMKLLDAVEKYKPEIMILNFGTFSTTWITEDTFTQNANSLLDEIKEKSPNTKIILISIFPILNKYNINNFTQEKINRYNYLILEMASKHNLKYLDVQEVLKDENGYGNPKYIVEDGFHLTLLGHSLVKNYIKTHAIEN